MTFTHKGSEKTPINSLCSIFTTATKPLLLLSYPQLTIK